MLNAVLAPNRVVQIDEDTADLFWECVASYFEALTLRHTTTATMYRICWRHWCAHLSVTDNSSSGAEKLVNASPLHVQRYLSFRKNCPGKRPRNPSGRSTLAGSTINREWASLSSIYRMLNEQGFVIRNPFRLARPEVGETFNKKRPTEAVDYTKVRELLEAPSNYTDDGIRDRALIALAFAGGLRRSEITKLNISDVQKDPEGLPYLCLRATKNGEDAEQALFNIGVEPLERHFQKRLAAGAQPGDPLFLAPKDRSRHLSNDTYYKIFKYWCKMVGLPESITPHSARKTAITRLLDAGESHRIVQEFSRHKSVMMVEKYDARRKELKNSPARKHSF